MGDFGLEASAFFLDLSGEALRAGGPAAAACHVARTIVRRAERRVFTLSGMDDVRPEVMRYLNRLSDLLFVVARVVARAEKGTEVLWNRERS